MDTREIIAKTLAHHRRNGYDSHECHCGARIVGTSPRAERNHQAAAVLAALEAEGIVLARYGVRYLVPLESLPESEK
jgi:hypothetical protein